MSTDLSSFSLRISEASKVTELSENFFRNILSSLGIEDDEFGMKLLDSSAVDELLIESTIRGNLKEGDGPGIVRIRAAAKMLKGVDPFEEKPARNPENLIDTKNEAHAVKIETPQIDLSDLKKLLDNKPVQQMRDRELLENWARDREYEAEQELHRRAKGQHFIVLKPGKTEPGKEAVDIENSLELLKLSRKRAIPSMIPMGNTVAPVYRITELNLEDRIIEICPICGDILFRGYCSKCESDFSGIGEEERAFISCIVSEQKIDPKSYSDKKALLTSAMKGMEDLRKTWPSYFVEFSERKAVGNLPSLKKIANRPAQRIQDPFHVDGNRAY